MMKHLACGMAQTLFLQLIQSKIDMFITSDRLCLSAPPWTRVITKISWGLTITYNLTDDETFSLWDGSDFVFATCTKQNWYVYYIGSVVFISFNILYSIGYRNIGKKSYWYISIVIEINQTAIT